MLDPKFTVAVKDEEAGYAKLIIEPLRQGYGHTLGNSLRRVMLNSISGAAITSIKIKGVKHQFSTLKGMSEDIVGIVLNTKMIRVRMDDKNSDPVVLKLEASGPGEVTAGDIQAPVGVTIANPELVIANLADKSAKLEAELTVESGQGYSLAEERKSTVVGLIPIDALFSPVKRVNPTVSTTRVGRRTDFDKITLEVWTDGTITPREALDQAAQIMVEHYNQIIDPSAAPVEAKKEETDSLPSGSDNLTVEELDLPTRIANALRKGGFKTVADLANADRQDVVKVKNLGERSVTLVDKALALKGVTLD